MFTADARPEDPRYSRVLAEHMRQIVARGYDGFDLHLATRPANDTHHFASEVDSYRRLKTMLNDSGLEQVQFATNVGATSYYDPTSPYAEQRTIALEYLKSRVDITRILGGTQCNPIMSGPFLYPYGAFPVSDHGDPLWSDALQHWMKQRYQNALPVFDALAEYAANLGVRLAIEPVKNWEMPPPNMISEVLAFLDDINRGPCGLTIDTAQAIMESQGPSGFRDNVARAAATGHIAYVHISSPDRGTIRDSWIPWDIMLKEIEPVYDGPYLIEIFNAIPPFDASMRLTRKRYWRPGEDVEGPAHLNAYNIAQQSLEEFRQQLAQVRSSPNRRDIGSRTARPDSTTITTAPNTPKQLTFGMRTPSVTKLNTFSLKPLAIIPKFHKPELSSPLIISSNYSTRHAPVRIHTYISSYVESIANATHIVEGAHSLIVVDGQFLAPYAKHFREYIQSLNKPIERVFLSHRHPDHWFGMPAAFNDHTVLALPETIRWINDYGEESLKRHLSKVGPGLAPSTHSFNMTPLYPHEEDIDGIHYVFEKETDAEVEEQLTITIPELGVAIVQDLIYSGTHLYLTKHMDHWQNTLQRMIQSECHTFLPGHGVPAGKGELLANIEYLIAAQAAFASGTTKEELQQYLVARYPGRLCPEIFRICLPRLFGEAGEV